MAYIPPSTLVYQQLASNAGVANITPDLSCCIVGPCYNVITYDASTTGNLLLSLATFADNSAATIADTSLGAYTVYLPGVKVGQVLDPTSISVYLTSASVSTKTFGATLVGTSTTPSNVVNLTSLNTTASGTLGTNTVTVASAAGLYPYDTVTIAGAGLSGSNLKTQILSIAGTTVTLLDSLATTVTTAALTKNSFKNTNAQTSTLRIEAGDVVIMTGSAYTITSTVQTVVSTSDEVVQITLVDSVFPTTGGADVSVEVRKAYNNLLLPQTYNTYANYSTTSTTVDNSIVISTLPKVAYGTIHSGTVHAAYKALRTDLSATVLSFESITDAEGTLGTATDDNPLSLGVQLALANTTGAVQAISIASNDLVGYQAALDLAEQVRIYALVPLTQSIDILSLFQQHSEQMSTPEVAGWRMSLVNTAIASVVYVGQYNPNLVNANGGNNTISLVSGSYILNSSNSTFISDGVVAGDLVKITAHSPATPVNSSLQVLEVISNQQLRVAAPSGALTAVSFYIQRNLTKVQQAANIAAASTSFGSSRVVHVQPDLCGVSVNGVTKYLPGYYLCAGLAGLISGLPAQKGLTNIGLAGFTDLSHSNFYFTRAQLNTIAASGTLLMVQEAQGTLPYVRHSLTTDMTVLQYREVQQVKNIDFVSYYFYDITKGFTGKYNITPDTLRVLRTTLEAGISLLKSKNISKIGAPLTSATITKLEQNSTNKDNVDCVVNAVIPTVMNYINIYLVV